MYRLIDLRIAVRDQQDDPSMKLVLVQTPTPHTFVRVVPDTTTPTYPSPSTDILCWHCCHAFDTAPVPMPIGYDSRTETFRVFGTFCSFACIGGYLRDMRSTLPGASNGSIGMIVFDFFKKMTGCTDPRKFVKAPPRCMLRAFGGHMTLDEFRTCSEHLEYVPMAPLCILHEQVYHERRRDTSHTCRSILRSEPPQKDQRKQAHASDSHASTGGETLKLKRKYQYTKDHHHHHHQHQASTRPPGGKTILEQALGIA